MSTPIRPRLHLWTILTDHRCRPSFDTKRFPLTGLSELSSGSLKSSTPRRSFLDHDQDLDPFPVNGPYLN